MISDWPFECLSMYKSVVFKRGRMKPAVNAAKKIERNSPLHFFNIEYTDRDSVYITRVPNAKEALKGPKMSRENKTWPFLFMNLNAPVTYTGADVRLALERLRSLRREHEELHFSILRHEDSITITKVESAGQAVNETSRTKWPYKGAHVDRSFEFDITFMREEGVRVSTYAHAYAQKKGWRMKVRTSNTADGRRIVTVTRIS